LTIVVRPYGDNLMYRNFHFKSVGVKSLDF